MSRNCHVESGIQFLSRVKNYAFDLRSVDNYLFAEGLKPNDVVELSAETVFLKKAFLYYLIRKMVLTCSFKGVPTDGSNCRVLYLDLSSHFNINEFVTCVERYVDTIEPVQTCTAVDKTELVENTLRNLIMVKCYSGEQLRSTLQSLRLIISADPRVKFVVLDAFACNYWQDVVNGDFGRNDYRSSRIGLTTFVDALKSVKLAGLYVTPEFSVVQKLGNCYGKVSYKVRVRRKDNRQLEVVVTSPLSTYYRLFGISGSVVSRL